MRTGLEPLVEKLANAAGPYRTPAVPPVQGHPLPPPTHGSWGLGRGGLAAAGIAAAGVGAYGLLHQHKQDAQQYPQVAPPLTGVY